MYRGLLQGSMVSRASTTPSPSWPSPRSSPSIHFRWVEFPGLFVFGLILGVCALRTGRLGMGIAAHMAFNATGLSAGGTGMTTSGELSAMRMTQWRSDTMRGRHDRGDRRTDRRRRAARRRAPTPTRADRGRSLGRADRRRRIVRRPRNWLDAPWTNERIARYLTALIVVGGSTFAVLKVVHLNLRRSTTTRRPAATWAPT